MGLLDFFGLGATPPSIGGGSIRGGYGAPAGLLGGADLTALIDPRQAQLQALSQGLAGAAQGVMSGRGLGPGIVSGLIGASSGVQDARKQALDQGLLGLKVQDYLDQHKSQQKQMENEAKRQAALDNLVTTPPKAWLDRGGDAGQWKDFATADPDGAVKWVSPQELAEPKVSGGMQWTPQGGWQDIPGYTDQAAKIAAAGRQPAAPSDFDRLAAAAGLKPGSPEYIAAANKKLGVGGEGGPYQGTAMDAQDMNILLDPKADTSSPTYAQAYARQYQTPRYQPSQIPGPNGTMQDVLVSVMPTVPKGIRVPAASPAAPAPAIDEPAAPIATQQPTAAPAAAPAVPGQGQVGATIVIGQSPKRDQPLTEDQRKNQQLYQRSAQQLPILLDNFEELSKLHNQVANAVLPDQVSNYATSEGFQRANNALNDISASYLYSVSGATANPGEVLNLARTLVPRPGESAQSVADKKQRVQQMVESIHLRSTGNVDAANAIDQQLGQSGAGGAPVAGAAGGNTVMHFDAQGNLIQ